VPLTPETVADVLSFSARSALLEQTPVAPSPARVELWKFGLVSEVGAVTELGAAVKAQLTTPTKRPRAHKFGAVRCYATHDDQVVRLLRGQRAPAGTVSFPSLREARRWVDLRRLQRIGEISELQRQVSFPLYAVTPDGTRIKVSTYIADFVYTRPGIGFGVRVVEDAKGMRTKEYRLKKKWFEAQAPGLTILEV
jgi:uncharacterized protein DUF1064